MKKIKFIPVVNTFGKPMLAFDDTYQNSAVAAALAANGTYIPAIAHITFNSGVKHDKKTDADIPTHVTIVDFADGTRVKVVCSSHDVPDRQTAVVNAIVKRIFGTVDDKGNVEGNGAGIKIRRLVESAFDQTNAAEKIAAQKAKVQAEHAARQKAAHDAAYEKRVKREAEKIKVMKDALAYLEANGITIGSDHVCSCGSNCCCEDEEYVRPDKKFKDFTQEEKRAYWRWQKSK